ncbi:MAG: response regulator [Spirochaetia bacterium]|nr:response regulator [Spirochaetia bacterium]MCF7940054.1 response regulator [Spirochaetia bacterium]
MTDKSADSLRQRAIETLKHQDRQITADSIDLQTVIEELNIYHIELEHQNDNLRTSQYELEMSRERFSALFRYAPVGYIIFDDESVIHEINELAGAMLQLHDQTVSEQRLSFTRYIDPAHQDTFYFHTRKVFSTHCIDYCEIELKIEGRRIPVRLQSQLDPSCSSGECRRILCSIIDISESKKIQLELFENNIRLQKTLEELQSTQRQLIVSERLSAVGQLTAGIAHDFNNILSGMMGYAELLNISEQHPQWMHSHLDALLEAGERASRLVKQLLDFSSISISDLHVFNMREVLEDWFAFIRHTIAEQIQFSLQIPESGDFLIFGDPEQVRQVLTNLAINAKDAIQQNGRIEVRLSMGDDNQVIIELSDTGSGISPEVLEHIFEPFFTTKVIGKGTGLGLSQAYGIMRQHDGSVEVEKNIPTGTIFRLRFPLAAETEADHSTAATEKRPQALTQTSGNETLLLVEDDKHMRNAVRQMLENLGYHVITAGDGIDGIHAYWAHRDSIRLVITDLVMPDMGGAELIRTIHEEAPQLPVILITGYPLHTEVLDEIRESVTLLKKPFSLSTLSLLLQETLQHTDADS